MLSPKLIASSRQLASITSMNDAKMLVARRRLAMIFAALVVDMLQAG